MNHRGFTLLELLLVIAIIGILAAVVIPLFSEPSSTLELKRTEWACEKSEVRRYTYLMMIGKVPIQKTGQRAECVLYVRHPEQN